MVQISVGNYFMDNSYSITKSTAERFARMYHNEHKVDVSIVRALNAFGEGQKWHPVRKMMPYFISRALKDLPIEIYGDGSQQMDFVYVGDVANILINVLETRPYGETHEAGTGVGPNVRWWAEKVTELSGSHSIITYLPMRPGEPEKSKVVASNPYGFPYTDTVTALKKVITWYRKTLNKE
jgi:nucleoside-diphosphate-sugar epimerase